MAEMYGLADHVDPGSFARGFVYATKGASTITEHDPEAGTIRATTQGSASRAYDQRITYALNQGRSTIDFSAFHGSCTCPVGFNCKHCVSAALTALSLIPAGVHTANSLPRRDPEESSQPSGYRAVPGRPRSTRPEWRNLLDQIFPGEELSGPRLALALELSEDPRAFRRDRNAANARPIAIVRPLRMSDSGNWVKSGIDFDRILSGYLDADVHQRHELAAFVLACHASPGSELAAYRDAIVLSRLSSSAPGEALRAAMAVGVTLVNATTKRPVVVEKIPATARLVLSDDDGELALTAVVEHPRITNEWAVIGMEASAVVWSEYGELHLAWIDSPATHEWSKVFESGKITVPREERADFEREFWPRIARGGVDVEDFQPPELPTPCLRLTVEERPLSGVPVVTLIWDWVYINGAGQRVDGPFRLEPPLRKTTVRDVEREREIRSGVESMLHSRMPALLDEDGTLLAQVDVRGIHLLTLTEILDEVRALDVRVDGEVTPYVRSTDLHVDVSIGQSHRDWLDLEVIVRVDGAEVPLAMVIAAVTLNEPYLFLPGGSVVDISTPELDQLRILLDEARELSDHRSSGLRVPRVRTTWWNDLLSLGIVRFDQESFAGQVHAALETMHEPAEVPHSLHATLRPYQVEGFQWLAALRDAGFGGVLADDMGLGKTIQILAMILRDREQTRRAPADALAVASADTAAGTPANTAAHSGASGPWIVVAPTSVVSNWVAEASTFTPSLSVVAVTGTQKRRGAPLAEVVAGADIIVTSYTLMRLEADEYRALNPTGLVLDEAQNVKNSQSKAFAVAASLGAPTVFTVTGTPIENNLTELWAMFALATPGLLGTPAQFAAAYRKPIERALAQASEPSTPGTAASDSDAREEADALMARLRRRIAPFILRCTKQTVALDLPEKQEQVLEVDLDSAHRRLYERHLARERQRLLGLADDIDAHRIEILSSLTRLRQLAIDPRLVDQEFTGTGSKLAALIPLLTEIVAEGHSVIVFSQFTRFLGLIAERLDAEHMGYVYLDGSTRDRGAVIQEFTDGKAPIFLISLKAGGTGLNLTIADYAILTDPWWNPAVEEQAVDRTHRIGQTRPVHVYRMVSAGTIEQKVVALQEHKRKLLSVITDDDPRTDSPRISSGALTPEQLRELLM